MKPALHVIMIFLLLAMIPACGGDSSPDNSGSGGGPLKIIRFGRGADAVRLDPQTISDGESAKVIINLFDTLVRFKDDSLEIEACLAESWDARSDGKAITFHLRKGVKFHDGTAFSSEAVKFSLDRLFLGTVNMPTKNKQSPYKSYYQAIDHVECVDEYTVTIHLKEKDYTLLINLAMFPASIVSPTAVKKDTENFMHHPVGSGPFKFSSWQTGVQIVIEKNPEYWGTVPKIDKIVFENAKEPKPRVRNLLKGDFDIIDGIRPEDVPEMKSNPDVTVIEQPGMNICYLALNNRATNGTHLQKVRRAISLAIDRDELNIVAYGGQGIPLYSPIPKTIPGAIEVPAFKEHDLEQAKRLLAEAGYPDGLKLELFQPSITRPYLPDAKSTAIAIKSQLAKIGIDVQIIENEWGSHITKTENAEHDMCLLGWSTDNGDPDNFVSTFYSKKNAVLGSALNVSFYENDDMEALLIEGLRTLDQSKRAEIYKKIQLKAGLDAPLIPLMSSYQYCAYRKRLRHFVLHPMDIKRFYKTDLD